MTSRQHPPSSGSHLSRALKRAAGILALFLLLCALVPPLVHKTVTEPVPITGSPGERVAAVDSNREAMLWRLRLIRSAQESLILSTFDLRPDETGLDILAALQEAADRGVRIQILADGICGAMYLQASAHFRALAAMPNVEARFYNPINLLKPWALNYRMHDKYLIVDNHAYLLGGRNTYDLFLREDLGHYNIDRDVLVYVPEGGGSLEALRAYFDSIWSLGETGFFPLPNPIGWKTPGKRSVSVPGSWNTSTRKPSAPSTMHRKQSPPGQSPCWPIHRTLGTRSRLCGMPSAS